VEEGYFLFLSLSLFLFLEQGMEANYLKQVVNFEVD